MRWVNSIVNILFSFFLIFLFLFFCIVLCESKDEVLMCMYIIYIIIGQGDIRDIECAFYLI